MIRTRICRRLVYIIHSVPKYSGGKWSGHKRLTGFRIIEEPIPELKQQQRLFVKQLQNLIIFPQYINGVHRTSTITNSKPHVHKSILYKIDLKDFFQTVTIDHIKLSIPDSVAGLCPHGSSEPIGDGWIDLCMYCHTECDGPSCKLGLPRRLPTGAPTSPILANIAFMDTDKKIVELLRNTDISYTRYMDDLSFSSNALEQLTPELVNQIFKLIELDKWTINRKKSGLSLSFKRQEVTGIVVNQKINLARDKKLLLRSKLDHLARISNILTPELQGELAYIKSIDTNLFTGFNTYFNKRVNFYETQAN